MEHIQWEYSVVLCLGPCMHSQGGHLKDDSVVNVQFDVGKDNWKLFLYALLLYMNF
jgi:hypothetical protein